MSLTLFVDRQFASPYAMSAYVTLVEKGLPFALETIDLAAADNLREEYRDRSLTARVPTLAHDAFYLSESTAIVEYLEEVFPAPEHPSVLPAEVQNRAKARQIQAWLRSDLLALRNDWTTETVFLGKVGGPLSEAGEQAAEKLLRVARALLLKDTQPHLFDRWCIADTDLALMLQRLLVNGYPMPAAIADYANHQWQHPSVQQWINLNQSGSI